MPFQLTVENVNDPPTSIRLVRSQVSESVPGLRIGALQVVDPDPADQFTWQISDPRFVVLDNELWLSTTSSLDFELESSIVIQATVTDNGSPNLSLTSPLTIEVIDVNEFFPELQSQTLTIPNGLTSSTLITTYNAVDRDTRQTVRYRLSSGDISSFAIGCGNRSASSGTWCRQ